MGRAYATELEHLPDTYRWALREPIDGLVSAIQQTAVLPILAIGSGGSLTTARYMVALHQSHTGRLGRHLTPLELAGFAYLNPKTAVWFFSAGGSNPDAVSAFALAATLEPALLLALTTRTDSQIKRSAERLSVSQVLEFEIPSGKDGFLATNSLLASMTLLTRAYNNVLSPGTQLPGQLVELLASSGTWEQWLSDFQAQTALLWSVPTILVLHGPSTSTAAVDIESRWNEAALGNIHTADYRNFAHGRHYWLSQHAAEVGVLALITHEDRDLAERTLRELPDSVIVVPVVLPERAHLAELGSVVATIVLAGLSGKAQGRDPGRPRVPEFGRRLYNMRSIFRPARASLPYRLSRGAQRAIERKAGESCASLAERGELQLWRRAHETFLKNLKKATFTAVILDYDGTLIDSAERPVGPRQSLGLELDRLLRQGCTIGIATGRGGSVRKDLRRIIDRGFWGKVTIGYYNGADIGCLDDQTHPDKASRPLGELADLEEILQDDAVLSGRCEIRVRPSQITLIPHRAAWLQQAWSHLQHLVQVRRLVTLSILQSGHSVDILDSRASKQTLVDQVARASCSGDLSFLPIGDRGSWPGNDYVLLQNPHALSADEVSLDPSTCWNLAPPGQRGAAATLHYLKALLPTEPGIFRFVLNARSRR